MKYLNEIKKDKLSKKTGSKGPAKKIKIIHRVYSGGSGGITTLYCWKSIKDQRVYSTTLTPKSVLRAENYVDGEFYGKISNGWEVYSQEGDTIVIYRVDAFTRFPDDDIELN